MPLRDTNKENLWYNHMIIGYVSLDKNGNPYQPTIGRGRSARTKPITVYKDMSRAVTYSPVDSASEVRMFQPINVIGE